MFYLKYRPKTIGELDNTRVSDILKKILQSKIFPHALLFVGQKGTGKTSAARIFAKSVNCLNNKFAGKSSSFEPCNNCANCKNINTSSSTDVLELDAASNRGIEEIKNLIRETAFLPMSTRYRVFIIDEAHMITPDGFNALLKTLEEPPSTAIFILATTNQEKIPKTIASRCIKINFGKAKKQDIILMLKRITKGEKLELKDDFLKLVASHSEQSFRDAAKILEELSIQHMKTYEDAEKYLGVRGKTNLLELLEENDAKKVLAWIAEFDESGGNYKNLIEELLEELRVALLIKKGVIEDEENKIKFSVGQITLLIKLLMEAYSSLRTSPIESLPLEIAITEFYNLKKN